MGADDGHRRPGVKGAVLIAGPTASGKSALALAVAEKLNGTIINTDSMQVYCDLRVITARPSEAEEGRVPHRLYGHVDAADNYSIGRWLKDAGDALREAAAQGRVPVFVGGTGLYFKTLTGGLAAVPLTPPQIRAALRERLQREGIAALYAELGRLDPQSAQRLMPNDSSRILRALEVLQATGRSLRDWQKEGMPPLVDAASAAKVFLVVEREELVSRIEKRFDTMLGAGALEEVRALAARALDPMLPAMRAHGVPWLIRHINGEISIDEAAAGAKMDTRRYAKRQATWFRNQMQDWPAEPPEIALNGLEKQRDMV
ncbi:MAG: tRNA (adenosine(37)-N6)-dimethylallyltransferase MiaA [Pseudolabrys sp.]|nr:tRNA (adenosine(37)-N6)-dimethylallyltransferase MiaA [Pseudolabrys sp.]